MILFLQLSTLNHPGHIDLEPTNTTGSCVPRWRPFDGPKYLHAPEFVTALGPHLSDTEIVVTDWGVRWPDVAQRQELPTELREHLIDTLWLLDKEDYRSDLANLFGSIQFWLKQRRPGYKGPWLCVSDQYHSWPESERHRLIVGGGLNHPSLRAHFEQALHNAYVNAAAQEQGRKTT